MAENQRAPEPLRARRLTGGDVEVQGSGNTEGWRFIVYAADRSVRVIAPSTVPLNSSKWKTVPIGAIMRAVDDLTGVDRLRTTVAKLPKPRRNSVNDEVIVAGYRAALRAGLAPRTVVAARLGIGEDRAGREIRRLRETGRIASVHDERRQLAEEDGR
jgi:hypothetical protein